MHTSWVTPVALAAVAALAAFNPQPLVAADQWDARVDAIMATLGTDDIIGQMVEIAIYGMVGMDGTVNETVARQYAKLKVGSYEGQLYTILPAGYNGKYMMTAEENRAVVARIQNITMEENGGHPMIFGTDSVHGAVLTDNAVMFGWNINGAAAFNPDLVYTMGRVAARDSLAAGIPWLFSPVLDIATNPMWPRTMETFGEDPYTVSIMADAVIRGMQSINGSAACLKHFITYSKTPTGKDRDGSTLTDFELLNTFVPPFKAAIDAGVHTIMENYISVNGVPSVGNHKLMTSLLRHDLGFEGLVITDFAEVNDQQDFHHTARTTNEATKFTLERTSIDMSMGMDLDFIDGANALLTEKPDTINRLKESARRIIKTKVKLGLYDNPMQGEEYLELIGNDDDVSAALELARESIVLLQNNESTLPIANGSTVLLTGHNADNVHHQCGGWTVTVGTEVDGESDYTNEPFKHGITVKGGLENVIGNGSFTYLNGLNWNGTISAEDLSAAKEAAAKAEYTIAVIGEAAYTEKSGDIDDLALPAGQVEYIKELASTGTKVITVLFEGRPRLLGEIPQYSHAIVDGLLACELGGQAMAEILFGLVNPSGRLPITYPKHPGSIAIPFYHRVNELCGSELEECEMQWEFGHGLSYTTFNYSDLTLSTTNVTETNATLDVSVTVTNTGSVPGKETVMLFLSQPYRSFYVPEAKLLKKFSKIHLEAGESQTINFSLTLADWGVYYPQIGQGFNKLAEDADYVVAIKPETACELYNATALALQPLCATFSLSTGEHPYGTLDALD